MYECADALYFIHSKEYLYNDLKADNVIINEGNNSLHPIIIDFGKSTTLAKGKVYLLSPRDQERYKKFHKHIAPEVVRGNHPNLRLVMFMHLGFYCLCCVSISHMSLFVN